MADMDYPPGSMGFERNRILNEMSAMADHARHQGLRGRVAAWMLDAQRRKFECRMDGLLRHHRAAAFRSMGLDPLPGDE